MHGLFIISTLSDGGAQRVLSNLLMGLPENWGIDILLNDNGLREYPFRGRIISLGMSEKKNKKLVVYQLRVLFRRFKKLKKLKKQEDYDFCVSFMDSANLVNIFTPHGRTKTILSEHIYLSGSCSCSIAYRYMIGPMVRRLYNRADRIIAVSQEMKTDLVRNFNVNEEICHVVYNGTKLFAKEKTERKNDDFIITTMGRLEEMKGQWHLIRAVGKLASKYSQLRLIILGEGSLRNRLDELVIKLGIEDRVSIPGFVQQPMNVIAAGDLYVFPSHYEGFSMAMVEAMSCGIPVIASDFRSGAREVLAPDTDYEKKIKEGIEWAKYGCLVPVSHISLEGAENQEKMDEGEESLYLAIEKMITNEKLRKEYGEKAARRAADFTKEQMVQNWIREIRQVCGEKA